MKIDSPLQRLERWRKAKKGRGMDMFWSKSSMKYKVRLYSCPFTKLFESAHKNPGKAILAALKKA